MNKLLGALVLCLSVLTACAVTGPPERGGLGKECADGVRCAHGDLPTCEELGCFQAPSGTGDMSKPWEPCEDEICYCRTDDQTLTACTL